jgi:hypothetical protein
MATETVTANVLAARLTRDLKRPEYQAHLYSADDVRRITAGFKARSANARVQAEAKAPRAKAKAAVTKAKAPVSKATAKVLMTPAPVTTDA